MMNLKTYLFIGTVSAAAFISYSLTSYHYQVKIDDIKIKNEKILNQALTDKIKKEQYFAKESNNVQRKLETNLKDISYDYNNYLHGFLSDNSNSNSDRLSDSNTSSSKNMPSDSTVTTTVSKGRCECNGTDKAKLQRLFERQLTIARDCDITATHYNALIDLYDKVSK